MLSIMILLIISILPVFLIGMFIYKKDKIKEPTALLVKLFFGGLGSIVLVLAISAIMGVFPIFSVETDTQNLIELFINVFIGVALVEEFSKWFMVYIISYNNEDFDEFYDMILYCAFVALGFACFENILYVFDGGIGTGIARALLAVPAHVCNGVFMGYYLGLAKLNAINGRKNHEKKNIALSIIIPTIVHGIYDYCLMSGEVILIILFFVFVIAIDIIVIKRIKRIAAIDKKMIYKDKYCPQCGHIVNSNYCPSCGRKNN